MISESATGNVALYRRLEFSESVDRSGKRTSADAVLGAGLASNAVSTVLATDVQWSDPWEATMRVSRGRLATVAGQEYFISLGAVRTYLPDLDTEVRNSDLHIRQWPSETQIWELTIPPGLELEDIHETRSAPGMVWSLDVAVVEGVLRLERHIGFEARTLAPDEALELAVALEEIRERENMYLRLTP